MRCRSIGILLDASTAGRLSKGYRKVQARICTAGATPHMARLDPEVVERVPGFGPSTATIAAGKLKHGS